MSRLVASSPSWPRASTATLQLRRAFSRAVARPMPAVPPVTTTVSGLGSIMAHSSFYTPTRSRCTSLLPSQRRRAAPSVARPASRGRQRPDPDRQPGVFDWPHRKREARSRHLRLESVSNEDKSSAGRTRNPQHAENLRERCPFGRARCTHVRRRECLQTKLRYGIACTELSITIVMTRTTAAAKRPFSSPTLLFDLWSTDRASDQPFASRYEPDDS